jgi:hypothetical protein
VLSKSKVSDFDVPLGIDENVLRLQVAIDDVVVMKILQCK